MSAYHGVPGLAAYPSGVLTAKRLTFLREAWAALGARLNERLVYKSPIVLPEYSQLT